MILTHHILHEVANGTKQKCLIKSLEEDGTMITKIGALQHHITTFYKRLFGSDPQSNFKLHPYLWKESTKVSEEDNVELIEPFTLDEPEVVVEDLRDGSAPGPDGFNAVFFKFFWHDLKGPLLEMLVDLREGCLELSRLNYGIITLIPKIKGANDFRQCRPICLLNVVYKIISKVLTLRLNKVACKIISPNQTAFILGRYILDGVVVIHEVLHEMVKKKMSGIIIELDFEKAYDKVSWIFLKEVMIKKGFCEMWIQCVMKAVCGGRVAVNLNGELAKYFRSYKGLR